MKELKRQKISPSYIHPGDRIVVRYNLRLDDATTGSAQIDWTAPEDFKPQMVDEVVIFSLSDNVWDFAIGGMLGRRRECDHEKERN